MKVYAGEVMALMDAKSPSAAAAQAAAVATPPAARQAAAAAPSPLSDVADLTAASPRQRSPTWQQRLFQQAPAAAAAAPAAAAAAPAAAAAVGPARRPPHQLGGVGAASLVDHVATCSGEQGQRTTVGTAQGAEDTSALSSCRGQEADGKLWMPSALHARTQQAGTA